MGLGNAWRALRTKASATHPLLVHLGLGQPRWTPRRYDRLAEEAYRNNVVAYRCIRLISQNAAAVPWLVFERRGARRRELERHPLLDLLGRPNPRQGGAQFFESHYGFFLIAGNGYLEAVGPEGAPPRELWSLRPDRMTVIPGAGGLPKAYRYAVAGQRIDFPVDPLSGRARIRHSRSFHPLNDWYGMSPLEAAAFSIDQHNEAARWNAALLQNGARPAGALVYAPKDAADALTEEQRQAIKTELEAHYAGGRNAGRPLVLEGGLDWRDLSLSPKDMDWLAGKDVSAREIALAYNVPPQLVGIAGSLTFANFEQARLSLYEDAVLPLLDFFKDELNAWLAPAFGALEIAYDPDEIPALAVRRDKVWEKVQRAGFLTLNEKRVATGYAPVEGGDVILTPAKTAAPGERPSGPAESAPEEAE